MDFNLSVATVLSYTKSDFLGLIFNNLILQLHVLYHLIYPCNLMSPLASAEFSNQC